MMKVYATRSTARNRAAGSRRPHARSASRANAKTIGSGGVGTSASASWQAATPRRIAFVMLLALGLQFLLGMLTNLYVQVPAAHPGSGAANYFAGVAQGVLWALVGSTLWLRLHVVLGLLVFLGAIALLVRAIAVRSRAWIILASLGLLGIIGAGFNGASFMNYGHDLSSLIMSATFLLAMIVYLIGLYLRD